VLGTTTIIRGLSVVSVLTSIKFDDQPRLNAAKISKEVVDRMVAPKFGASQSAAVKQSPQLALRVGLAAAESASASQGYGRQ
jgi:hypothetical protein